MALAVCGGEALRRHQCDLLYHTSCLLLPLTFDVLIRTCASAHQPGGHHQCDHWCLCTRLLRLCNVPPCQGIKYKRKL